MNSHGVEYEDMTPAQKKWMTLALIDWGYYIRWPDTWVLGTISGEWPE